MSDWTKDLTPRQLWVVWKVLKDKQEELSLDSKSDPDLDYVVNEMTYQAEMRGFELE